MTPPNPQIPPQEFRYVLGNYPTGVTLVTSSVDGEQVGMVVGTFTSVSLSPPLIGFLPAKTSTTWPRIQESGKFCVNVLASNQESVCRDFATKEPDRFAKSVWRDGELGVPVLMDSVAWVECTIESVLDAGDHWFVVGRVQELGAQPTINPLLFFHGGYGGFRAKSMLSFDADVTRHIRLAALIRDRLEDAAQRNECGCVVIAHVGSELVVVSSFGDMKKVHNPAWAGLRQPFMAPLGSQFAAFLTDSAERRAWAARFTAYNEPGLQSEVETKLHTVRERGYAVACDPGLYSRLTQLAIMRTEDAAPAVDREIALVARQMLVGNEPPELKEEEIYDVWALHAPVRVQDVAFSIGLYPRQEDMHGGDVRALGAELLDLTANVETFLRDYVEDRASTDNDDDDADGGR